MMPEDSVYAVSQLEIMIELQDFINGIADSTVDRIGSKLEPVDEEKKEKCLGNLHSPTTKRLWVAFQRLDALEDEYKAKANLAADDFEETQLKERALRASTLSILAKNIFWMQVRAEMGAWDNLSIGLRKDYMMVSCQGDPNRSVLPLPPGLRGLLGLGNVE